MPNHPIPSSRKHCWTSTQTNCALHTFTLIVVFATGNNQEPCPSVRAVDSSPMNTVSNCSWQRRMTVAPTVQGVASCHPDCLQNSLVATETFSTFSVTEDMHVFLQPPQPPIPSTTTTMSTIVKIQITSMRGIKAELLHNTATTTTTTTIV